MKKIIYALLIILFCPVLVFGQYKVGDKVSDFTLTDINGDSKSLSDNNGTPVLVYFFTSW